MTPGRRGTTVLLAVGLALLATGCQGIDGSVGLQRTDDDGLEVVIGLCDDERLTAVSISAVDEDGFPIEGTEWRAEAPARGVDRQVIPIAEELDGFTVEGGARLDALLDPMVTKQLVVTVHTTRPSLDRRELVATDDLPEDGAVALTSGRPTPATVDELTDQSCGNDRQLLVVVLVILGALGLGALLVVSLVAFGLGKWIAWLRRGGAPRPVGPTEHRTWQPPG